MLIEYATRDELKLNECVRVRQKLTSASL